MRKAYVSLALALGTLLVASSLGWAGLCLDAGGACNDFFVSLEPAATNVFGLHGYEYGCSYSDRQGTGSLHLAGNNAYYALQTSSGASGAGDYGNMGTNNAVISLSTFTGSYYYNYLYLSGGVAAGHGGSGSMNLSICSGAPSTQLGLEPDLEVAE